MEPVVGRDRTVRAARAALEARGSLVITGAAGMGKTALVRSITAEIDDRVVLWNAATSAAAQVSLGAIAPLLDRLGVDLDRPVEVLATISSALVDAFADAVVVVDDAHLLDPVSAAVVHRLVTGGATVALTLRTGEDRPDAVDAICADPRAETVALEPFDRAAVVLQLESILDAPCEPVVVDRIHELSGGSPLFVREIVLAGVESGWLEQLEGKWRLSRAALPPNARLRELIARRFRECSPAHAEVLEAVAMAETVELAALASMAGIDAVMALEERSLVRVIDAPTGPVVTVDHPIIGEVVRQMGRSVRQRVLSDRLVEALLGLGEPTRERRLRIGHLTARSTSPRPALLLDAASVANTTHDFVAAASFARMAATGGGGLEAELVWAEAAISAGDFTGAASAVVRALERDDLTERQRLQASVLSARVSMWGFGRADEAERSLGAVAVHDQDSRGLLDVELAFLLLNRGRISEVIDLGTPWLDAETHAVRLRAAAVVASAMSMVGAIDQVQALLARHLGDAVTHAEHAPRAAAELMAAEILVQCGAGESVAMGQTAAGMAELAAASADPELEGVSHLMMGLSRQARGHVTDAVVAIESALACFERNDGAQLAGWTHAVRAHLAAVLGDVESAKRHLDASVRPPFHALTTFDFDRNMARTRMVANGGDHRRAATMAREFAAQMGAVGRDVAEATFLDLASRLGDRSVVDRLVALADRAEGRLIPALAEHAMAAAAADVDRLFRAADRLEALGDDFGAADAAAEAARAAHRQGRKITASAAGTRSLSLLERCGIGASTLPLPRSLPGFELTRRELDIARLAAQGQTNRDIGVSLSLSPRTVGNHLYRIYAKVGVAGRVELADALRDAGILRTIGE